MLRNVKLSFIGSGNMAEAMIKGVLTQKLIQPEMICASGPRRERADELHARYGIQGCTDNRQAARWGDVVVLSVKPQILPSVMDEIRGEIKPDALVLSIVAGARIKVISRKLGHKGIVRAMPNTPGQVGKGITVWTATEEVTETQRKQAKAILGALGEDVFVKDEDKLDMATALSGTGPAYVFLFMEAMIDAGVHMGFSRRISEKLVLQTIEGSVAIARDSKKHPAVLRNMVTSPGGTSAEALYQLEKGGLRTVISRAIWAAYQKSKYLGDLSEDDD